MDKYIFIAMINWETADKDLSKRVRNYKEKKAIAQEVMTKGDSHLTKAQQDLFELFVAEVYLWFFNKL